MIFSSKHMKCTTHFLIISWNVFPGNYITYLNHEINCKSRNICIFIISHSIQVKTSSIAWICHILWDWEYPFARNVWALDGAGQEYKYVRIRHHNFSYCFGLWWTSSWIWRNLRFGPRNKFYFYKVWLHPKAILDEHQRFWIISICLGLGLIHWV